MKKKKVDTANSTTTHATPALACQPARLRCLPCCRSCARFDTMSPADQVLASVLRPDPIAAEAANAPPEPLVNLRFPLVTYLKGLLFKKSFVTKKVVVTKTAGDFKAIDPVAPDAGIAGPGAGGMLA